MFRLNARNVLLKPSNRRQLFSSLRRSLRLGERLGDFDLQIDLLRSRGLYEMRARVHDSEGDFACRSRGGDFRDVTRNLVSALCARLHAQRVQQLRMT